MVSNLIRLKMKKYIFAFVLLFSFFLHAQSQEKDNSTNLLTAGGISVTIGGDFIVTGTYPAMITERVDQFVTRMFNNARNNIFTQLPKEPEFIEKARKDIESYSIRNVILKRSNGEELKLDLLKFRKMGDFSQNPYLRNDDVIIFPPSDLERNFFSISGAINKPGKYHFRDGDKLSDAIELAQGINKAYQNVTRAEINRLSYNGEQLEVIPVDLNSDFDLMRGDRISIVADETQKKEFSVTIIGEVKMPGKIPITRNSTSLRDVINRAGGVTENAFLKQAKVYTSNTVPMLLSSLYDIDLKSFDETMIIDTTEFWLKIKEALLYRMSNVNYEERDYFMLESKLKALLEEGSVNFLNYESDNSEASRYYVKDGDVIYIPAKQHKVYVFGQVVNPGYRPYSDGLTVEDYIREAGGLGEYAQDKDYIMVIKGGTNEWIPTEDRNVPIEEGDMIYVPREMSMPFSWYVGQAGNYLSIVASVATVILLLVQFNTN
jgi:protein involved in polysaccharide export with SLBB domain